MLGYKFDEFMVGTHSFIERNDINKALPLYFSLTWGNKNLFRALNPFSGEFLSHDVKGFITVGDLVDKVDCEGSLDLLYFSEGKIRYELFFKDDNGKSYKYEGEKRNIRPWNLHETHVTCYGTIVNLDDDEMISKSVVYFPFRELLGFVFSFRFRRGLLFKYS